ncbi:MAG TPA: right-handed parallel beta-helix repeat-containing protein [bacterium]|nr:right-handed parallel beta-helix repeat-containing protein [bacterium]
MRALPITAGFLILVLGAEPAPADSYLIAPDGSGDFPTIQAAVDAASGGDEILLEDGTFLGPGNRDVDYLGKAVTIRSRSGNRSACVIDCESADSSGFVFRSGEGNGSVLADLTVTWSHNLYPGVRAYSSSPTVRNVVVTQPRRTGMYAEYGAPVITGCLVESNVYATTYTAGISLLSASATIEDCSFRDLDDVACILAWGGTTTVRRCDFSGNLGTAISVLSGPWTSTEPSASIEDCVVTNNTMSTAIYLAGDGSSSFTVRRCVISGNTSTRSGWGLRVGSSGTVPFVIEYCLISGNPSHGMYLGGTAGGTVAGCKVLRNGGAGIVANGGTGSLLIENCEIEGNGGVGADLPWYSAATPLEIRDCIVRSNGTGIQLAGNPSVVRCTVQGNSGAGISVSGANGASVRECLVTGNGRGFAVVSSPELTVEHCTVASNHTPFSGGAMRIIGSGVTVLRSILWGNCSDADGYEIWQTTGSLVELTCVNVDSTRLHVFGAGAFTLTDLLEQDPLLCSPVACASAPSTAGVYGFSPGSPALAQPCGPMGAPQALCTAVGVQQSLTPSSWGKVKAGYRN